MTAASPIRRALVDLPVNTTGTPSTAHNRANKMQIGQKRPHWAIEEPENRLEATYTRVKVAARLGQLNTTQKVLSPLLTDMPYMPNTTDQILSRSNDTPQFSPLTSPPSSQGKPEREDQDSASSVNGFDADESITSQQTAATEVTQPVRSRASQVRPLSSSVLPFDCSVLFHRP